MDLAKPHPLIGTILDGVYRVDAWMADGGMATVYRGTQLLLDRPVAIKALHDDLDRNGDEARRFVREVELARGLSHPNIVKVYDGGLTEDDQLYLVMECLEGRNLADHVGDTGPLPFVQALPLFVQLCDGVEAVHAAGLLHRDLKPSNVFVTRTRKGLAIKVLDFGLARQADTSANSLLMHDTVLGTAGYLAPEQIDLGFTPDQRADVYALGALLAFILVGANPFKAPTMLATLQQQMEGPSRELLAELPAKLAEVIRKALAPLPAQRYANVSALREAVLEVPREATGRHPTLPVRPGKPVEADFNTDAIPLDIQVDAQHKIAEYPIHLRAIANLVLDVLRTAGKPLTTSEIRDRTRYQCQLDVDAYLRVLAALANDQLIVAGVGTWRANSL